MGGVSTLLLFVKLNILLSLVLKILLGLLMVIITFGFKSIKYTLNNMFYLLTTSFSVGGGLFLLMDYGFYNYIVLVIGFVIVVYLYIKQYKQYHNNYSNYYSVDIYFKNRKYEVIGFLDTGNKLYDTYKHRPVIIIDKKIKYNLEDIIYVPYVSLNNESVLKCIKPEKVVIKKRVFHNYLVGFSNNRIKIDGVNCILHSKMKGDLYA